LGPRYIAIYEATSIRIRSRSSRCHSGVRCPNGKHGADVAHKTIKVWRIVDRDTRCERSKASYQCARSSSLAATAASRTRTDDEPLRLVPAAPSLLAWPSTWPTCSTAQVSSTGTFAPVDLATVRNADEARSKRRKMRASSQQSRVLLEERSIPEQKLQFAQQSICNFSRTLIGAKGLISLATPPGFEPGTFSLEGYEETL